MSNGVYESGFIAADEKWIFIERHRSATFALVISPYVSAGVYVKYLKWPLQDSIRLLAGASVVTRPRHPRVAKKHANKPVF